MLLVTVALVMAAMMVAMAMPAFAAPPDKEVSCYDQSGNYLFSSSTNEASGFRYLGQRNASCRSEGNVGTQEVTPEPGPRNPYPPGQGEPPLP
jgi:hypothetical protein